MRLYSLSNWVLLCVCRLGFLGPLLQTYNRLVIGAGRKGEPRFLLESLELWSSFVIAFRSSAMRSYSKKMTFPNDVITRFLKLWAPHRVIWDDPNKQYGMTQNSCMGLSPIAIRFIFALCNWVKTFLYQRWLSRWRLSVLVLIIPPMSSK